MTITENLIAELKQYIKERYKLVSFTGIFSGKKRKQESDIGGIAQGIRGKDFGEVSDLMSGFVKKNRRYETFAFVLDKLREGKGLSPVELYKRAWIDKRLYSKIMSTGNYKPAKNTAIAFGLALRLTGDEFAAFLGNAGFALSDSSVFDLVIQFCVKHEIFDIRDVNALLLQADQKMLSREAA
jgi:hypothetical protein